tara:strand:- start:537 stop:1661 length:1125 start_codon:yes stop_codon:yes gene_type:complete
MPSKFIVFLFGFILTGSIFAASPIEDYNASKTYSTGALVLEGQNSYIMSGSGTSLGQAPAANPSVWTDLSVAATALQVPTETVPTLSTATILNSLPGSAPSDANSSGGSTVSIVQKGLSTAGYVSSAAYLSGGFVVKGGSMKVIIMGKGAANVSNTLNNPRLDLLSGNAGWTSIASNSDWKSASQVTEITATNLMNGYRDTDSAVILTLAAGTYLANVHSQDGDDGGALVEIYDLDTIEGKSTGAYLSAISTNGTVLTGTAAGQKMSAGFHISGTGSLKVLLMAKGSTGATSDILNNPRLDLLSGNAGWTSIGNNSNWKSGSQVAEITATNLMNGYKDTDAALIMTLQPGVYIADVYSEDSDSGGALVEVYLIE